VAATKATAVAATKVTAAVATKATAVAATKVTAAVATRATAAVATRATAAVATVAPRATTKVAIAAHNRTILIGPDLKVAAIRAKAEAIRAKAEAIRAKAAVIKAKAEAIRAKAAVIKAKAEAIKAKAEAIKAKAEAIKAKAEATKAKGPTKAERPAVVPTVGDRHIPKARAVIPPVVQDPKDLAVRVVQAVGQAIPQGAGRAADRAISQAARVLAATEPGVLEAQEQDRLLWTQAEAPSALAPRRRKVVSSARKTLSWRKSFSLKRRPKPGLLPFQNPSISWKTSPSPTSPKK
jgi:hypothetical protein